MIRRKALDSNKIDAKAVTLISLLILIVTTNLLVFLMQPSGFSQGDSWGYGYGNFRNWDQLSFTGNSLRKWPVVLINSMLGNSTLQILFQSVISTLSWSYLLLTVNKVYNNNFLINAMITILAINPYITSWNTIQLSESYSISFLILLISISLRLKYYNSVKLKFYLILVLTLFLNTKPSNLISLIITLSLFSIFNLRKLTSQKPNKIFIIIVILVIAYSGLLSFNQSNQKLQEEGFGITYTAAQAVSVISNTNPEAAKVTSTLPNIEALACLKDYYLDKPETITNVLKTKCLRSQEWLDKNFNKHYAKFLISNPIYALELVSLSILAGNSPYSTYGGTVSILPASFESFYFGNRNYALRLDNFSAQNIPVEKLRVNAPIILWFLVFFMITIFNRLKYSRDFSNQLSQNSMLNYLFVFGFFIIISTAIVVPNEWYRQTIVGQVSIFITTILICAETLKRRLKTS
jgi:hypothetical protein